MIRFKRKEYSDRLTQGIYKLNRAKDSVHNFGVDLNKKIHFNIARKTGNQHSMDVLNRAINIDRLKHSDISAKRGAILTRKKLTPENIVKSAASSVVSPIKTGAKIIANPGPTVNRAISLAIKNPYLAGGEILDDLTTVAGVAYGGPTVKAISLNTPLRAVGAGLEGIASIFPEYKKRRQQAARTYNKGTLAKAIENMSIAGMGTTQLATSTNGRFRTI